MLRIGEMAKLCGVSIETLRYYDKENILTPDRVDEKSGYRYYSNESVEKYRLIEQLKELEFTLDEIRLFLCSDNGKRLLMYSRKKAELLKKQSDITKRILTIDSSCSEMNNGYPALNPPYKTENFIDDPDVIGRWDYCGDLPADAEFKGEDKLTKSDINHKTLIFMENGRSIWVFRWTKGILYRAVASRNIMIPYEYELFTYGNAAYMLLKQGDMKDSKQQISIYRKTDSHRYTFEEAILYKDNIDLDYIPDSKVIGVWKYFDFIISKSGFSIIPKNKFTTNIGYMVFYDGGICLKLHTNAAGVSNAVEFRYTNGCVIKAREKQTESYEVRNIIDDSYLIIEHKSGDYSYGGKVYGYYVFKRISQPEYEKVLGTYDLPRFITKEET